MLSEKKGIHRRDFLQLAGKGMISATLLPSMFEKSFAFDPPEKIPLVALQLYSIRDQLKIEIPETLKRIAGIGFEAVETAFWPEGVSVQQAAQYLKDAGLSVCAAHIELPIGNQKDRFLETAQAYGCKKMIWHGWPEDKRYSSLEGTIQLINIYNDSNHFAKSNGLQFGLHNHWWEFRNKVGGRYVYEVLLERLDPDIFFEIDTYWVKVAGQDPAAIVAKYGNRARFLHIKDGPAIWHDSLPNYNPDPMVAVGKGSQNFPAIAKAAAGNTDWMVVEMDAVTGDVYTAIQESYRYLVKNGLAKGKKAV